MKGKRLRNLSDSGGKKIWVEFESADSASCENCGACGTAQLIHSAYVSGVYLAEGQFLHPLDGGPVLNEFNPRIEGFYEWTE